VIVVAAWWAGLEWVRGWLAGGFGWGALGYALAPAPMLAQAASLGGVALLGFAVMGVNAALALATLRGIAVAAGVIGVLVAGGAIAMRGASAGGTRVAVVRSDVDPRRLVNVSRDPPPELAQAAAEGPALVVLPESALPAPPDDEQLRALARHGVPLIFGAPEPAEGGRFYNGAQLIRPDGTRAPPYRKHRLVPFAESAVASLRRVLPGPEVSPGSGGAPFEAAGVRVGVLVCFESLFADEALLRAKEADLIAVLTNDAWIGSSGSAQHLQAAVLRAIETGRPIAHAANRGVSALIDRRGRVLARADTPGHAVAALEPSRTTTLYARAPDLVPLVLLFAALATLARLRFTARALALHGVRSAALKLSCSLRRPGEAPGIGQRAPDTRSITHCASAASPRSLSIGSTSSVCAFVPSVTSVYQKTIRCRPPTPPPGRPHARVETSSRARASEMVSATGCTVSCGSGLGGSAGGACGAARVAASARTVGGRRGTAIGSASAGRGAAASTGRVDPRSSQISRTAMAASRSDSTSATREPTRGVYRGASSATVKMSCTSRRDGGAPGAGQRVSAT
jgi:apolipoprotein N-acyltransferase